MNLLDKFSAVEIKADNRISEKDKAFCQRQQEAFDKSGPALQRVAEAMEAVEREQQSILPVDENHCSPYITTNNFSCNTDRVYEAMKKRNGEFIATIVHYFSHQYSVDLDNREIEEHLIPAKPMEPDFPGSGWRDITDEERDAYKSALESHKKAKEEWETALCHLPLRYERIVDEIFAQLGGFSFQERAMNEFLKRTWDCCHHQYYRDPEPQEDFKIKNDTLRLTGGCWCHCNENKYMTHPVPDYRPADKLKLLLDALAWYECGRMNEGCLWFPELFKYEIRQNEFPINSMEKVESIKLFKNGRVDIKFRSAIYVQEFAEQCLRRNPA